MSWFWAVIFLSFAFSYTSEGYSKKSSAVVVGTVYCQTCFQQNSASRFIEGASVAVKCKDKTSSFRQEVKTDSRGEFKVDLPLSISKHVNKIKQCSVKLISSNKPYCAVAATATSSRLHLKSRTQGAHVFSAGFFTFRPLKEPEICDQKPSINGDEKISPISNPNDPTFLPPIRDPPPVDPPLLGRLLPPILSPLPPLLPGIPFLPPVVPKKEESPKASSEKTVTDPPTFLPPVQDPPTSDPPLLSRLLPPILPRLPPMLPKIPFLPPILPKKEDSPKASELSSEKTVIQPESFGFPPNPFNPPSIFPPNPFQPPSSVIPPIFPSPPPSIFPPLLPTPSSPPFFGQLPPFPGLTPSPSPPPPAFPIPFPPFPFQPTPGFPGVPPAKASKTSSP
ncbi:hypothetical protein ACP275_11G114700 [Erythranthe tilingii]